MTTHSRKPLSHLLPKLLFCWVSQLVRGNANDYKINSHEVSIDYQCPLVDTVNDCIFAEYPP